MHRWLTVAWLLCVWVCLVIPAFGEDRQEVIDRSRYGGSRYDKHREITYWGSAELSVANFHYGSGDVERMKLAVKGGEYGRLKPAPQVAEHFWREFRRLFGDIPFRDLSEGRWERYEKFVEEHKTLDYGDREDKWEAMELARRSALYGGRAGALHCVVRVKRSDFPVLYTIGCGISARENLRVYEFDETRDIGYSTPEHIAAEISQALTRLLEKKSDEMRKIRKYGRPK